LESFFNFI
jgi:hypothetical protein